MTQPPKTTTYIPFPGKLTGKLVAIDAPNIIRLQIETWPGFRRTVQVTLPGIVVPEDTEDASACQRELAKKALLLTQNFLADAKDIKVQDMLMKTSADKDVVAPVLTDKGGLIEALKREGLARSDAMDPKDPWCVEGTTGYSQERFKEPPAYSGPPRTGEQVYQYRCKSCHAKSTQGAPLPDDEMEWGLRVRKGMDVLINHVINGYKELMPARGGCGNCSDEELRAGIMYMLNASGVKLTQ